MRAYLRARGIHCVVPEKEDQKANRKRKRSTGGRPVTYDRDAYKRRNVVERSFNTLKNWRSLATQHDKLAPHVPLGRSPPRGLDLERRIRRHALGRRPGEDHPRILER
ncbi:hypothetical protein [Arthrobacter sp. NPDC058192]|uniref:hypothetical protein n=1 Tax=Arthrobacter sp. NPDC058192 TaxID=3346372 RepID=UPI0036E735BF